ncbi:hypothetical protein [Roseovarius sp. A46]|uniref:hypothetical protein n=1 Tax=Roseovarius sp. A46 TaxID=2109331 RepID=UPI001010C44D|nr:hypothetical protein [Roseovarius sp. A46]
MPSLIGEADGRTRAVLAVGQQDTDPEGLGFDAGLRFLGATSDHLIVDSKDMSLRVGSEVRMRLRYGALMRAMTTPAVTKSFHTTPAVKRDAANTRDKAIPRWWYADRPEPIPRPIPGRI